EHLAQASAPARAQHLPVRVALADLVLHADVQRVLLIPEDVERQADRDVRAQRRIERDQHALRRFAVRRLRRQYAIENRLSVLEFAELEVGRVRARLDEVALLVDVEKPRLLSAD